MTNYQRIIASTGALVGEPGPLPAHLIGLDDATLANLPAALLQATLAQLDLVDAGFLPVADPPPPEPEPEIRRLSRIGVLQRIPAAKRIAIRGAAKTDLIVEDFLDLLSATDLVELDDPDTVAGLNYLVSIGKLTAADVAAIRA